MHYVTQVRHDTGYVLVLTFEDNSVRRIDLESHLDGEVFEPLKELQQFATAHLNEDIDTVVWSNGADMSPDFLYEHSQPIRQSELSKVAEEPVTYGANQSPA